MKSKLAAHSIGWFGVLLLIQASATSFADELDNIQRARETAEMKYVNEIGSGKYKTQAQQEALRKELLDPQEQRTHDYFKSISVMPTPRAIKNEETHLKSVASNPAPPSRGNASSNRSSLRPEFVLDGSNVPKEVTFGTPDFESPNAKAKTK